LVSDIKGEHRLRVFDSRVLRIIGPKRDEMTKFWRGLHDEFHYLYTQPSIIRMIKDDEIGRTCSTNVKR
jgi:hypothetical protein